jgi:hypothetical protein
MFNNRIVIAQVELLKRIFLEQNKNYSGFTKILSEFPGSYRALAAWLLARDLSEAETTDIINHLEPYIKKGKIKFSDLIVSSKAIKIKDSETFTETTSFINFVHGTFPISNVRLDNKKNESTESAPVIIGQGIAIYDVNNANDARELAPDTSWCIAASGPNNMWKSYRISNASSFFIVYDDNPPTSNQRKVAIDFTKTGVELTDIPNKTGSHLTNGMDWSAYSKYLSSKGIDLNTTRKNSETGKEEKILQNKPLTGEEEFFYKYYSLFDQDKNKLTNETLQQWSKGLINIQKELIINKDEQGKISLEIPRESWQSKKDLPIKYDQIVSLIQNGIKYESNPEKRSINLTVPVGDLNYDINPDIRDFGFNLKYFKFSDSNDTKSIPSKISEITLKNDNARTYLSQFVGQGYELPQDVFDYISEMPDAKDLLIQYTNTGLTLPDRQIQKIKKIPNLFKSYARKQLIGLSRNQNDNPAILNYLDPNDANTKIFVFKNLLPQDLVDLEDFSHYWFQKIPTEWLKIPQLAFMYSDIYKTTEYTDEIAIKIALANGSHYYIKKYPTLENALIFLHNEDAINSFKDRAISDYYLPILLEAPYSVTTIVNRWQLIPDELKDLPELRQYKIIGESKAKKPVDKPAPYEDPANAYESATLQYLANNDNAIDNFIYEPNFWTFYLNNFDAFVKTFFKNVNKKVHFVETKEYEDDDDQDEEEQDNEWVEIDSKFTRQYFLRKILSKINIQVLKDQRVIEALRQNLTKKELYSILEKFSESDESIYQLMIQDINSFKDLEESGLSGLFYKDNPIIRKILSNGFNVDDFLANVKQSQSSYIWYLSRWIPEFIKSISDQDFIRIIRADENFIGDDLFRFIAGNKPHLINEIFNTSKDKLTKEQISYIEKNANDISGNLQAINPQTIPNYYRNDDDEDEEYWDDEEEEDDEDVLASVKSMLKIAQKLDFKKEYRLADKLTYIIRKKT